MTPDRIRDREELSEQIKALKALKGLAQIYGLDIRLGSGAGPKLVNVCRILKEVFVTSVLPSMPIPRRFISVILPRSRTRTAPLCP